MAEVNLHSWSEISQASEGLQLNSTAATWENILARLARIESRLLEHERRAASTLLPLGPEPDPPDGPLLYAATPPQFQITGYRSPPTYHQPAPLDNQSPMENHNTFQSRYAASCHTTTFQQHQHQSPNFGAQPQPDYQQQYAQPLYSADGYHPWKPEYQPPPSTSLTNPLPPPPYNHQPPPPPNTHQPPTPHYPQPPLHYPQQRPQSYRQPPLTAAVAASLPHQNYQPDGHQPCTGTPPLGWPPPPPQHSLSDWSPPSHGRSAAPLPAAAIAISKGKIDSSLSGLILFGRFDREQGNFNSVYGSRMKVHEGEVSDTSNLDAWIEYSCDDAKNFDRLSSSLDSYDGAKASVRYFCDLQTRLSEISATSVSKTSAYMSLKETKDAYASTCTAVTKIQPTPPPLPIFLPIIKRDFKILLQGNVHDRLDILKLRKMRNSSLLNEDRDGFYVDLLISNVAGMNCRLALLDTDARLIPPHNTGDDFRGPIEFPILDLRDDDGLSSHTTRSVNSQSPSDDKVLTERKQRIVAAFRGENKYFRLECGKPVVSDKRGSDVENSTTTRKGKEDNDGELKGAGSVQPSSIGKRVTKRMAGVSVSPMITDTKDNGTDGVHGGIWSRKPRMITVSSAEDDSTVRDNLDTLPILRERKKSKYLYSPYTNRAWRMGTSSFKSAAQFGNGESTKTTAHVENGEATKTTEARILSWFVAKHLKRGCEQQWLSVTISKDGIFLVSIAIALFENLLLDSFSMGPVSPFDLAVIFHANGMTMILSSWTKSMASFQRIWTCFPNLKVIGRTTHRSCVFDPGGDVSQKPLLASFIHLEDKVIFNRGGVDTRISLQISHISII